MNISPSIKPPVALPASVTGGGNAPSKRPASGDPFASFIAQVSGGDTAGVVGMTQSHDSVPTSRKRGLADTDDVAVDVASSVDDATDPMVAAIIVPPWLWTAPVATATNGSAQSDESTRAGDVNIDPSLGAVAEPLPALSAVSLAGPTGQPAPPAINADPSTPSAGSAGVSTGAPAEPGSPQSIGAKALPAGPEDAVAVHKNVPLTSADQSAVPATRIEGSDPQRPASSASSDQMESVASPAQKHRAGRAPAAYADAAGLTARAGGLSGDRASVASTAVSSDPGTLSGRTTETAKPGDRPTAGAAARAANSSGPIADAQSALAGALMAGRAQRGTAHNQAGQDSTPAFGEPQERAEDLLTSATQALEGTVAASALHPDHGSVPASGQQTQIGHVPALEQTLTSAVSSVSALVNRSAAMDDGSLHRQIVQAIHLQSRNGIGDARLTLQPEYLGEVSIALRVENGGVTAHVSAAASDVRAWLGANEALLRQGLFEQGLTLDRLIVSDEPDESSRDASGGNARHQQPQPDEKPRPRPRRDTGTFEITV